MKTHILLLAFSAINAIAAFPSVGPDYQRPDAAAPAAYRDLPTGVLEGKVAVTADAFRHGEWWKLFGDATLDDLMARALAANQELRAAAARVEQARAAAGLARSAYLPSLAADASVARARTSAATDNVLPHPETTTYQGGLNLSWEIDLFGRVRRLNEGARADAQAAADLFDSLRLTLTAEAATTYFSLRALDRERAIVADGVVLRGQALEVIAARRQSGAATDFDVARAETELASTEAESAALEARRAVLQGALAVLAGEDAPSFEISNLAARSATMPAIPAGLPSALLERRPDIAAAERVLASASARIGVARSAFFPSISLTGGAGTVSADVDRLFGADSRAWSVGPGLYLPIFQGGRNRANLERSRAAYEEAVASFRQRTLVAFREVQDALTAARWLGEQSAAQDRAVDSARRAEVLARKRYDSGYVGLLEVIDTQRTVLAAERASVQLGAQRLNTGVALIKSLGGGWSAASPVLASFNPSVSHP